MMDSRTLTARGPATKRSEGGAVIVLVTMLLVTFVAILAMAIDTAMEASAKTQQQVTANAAALSAIEAYFADSGNSAQKLAAAAAAAANVTHYNVSAQRTSAYFEDTSDQQNDIQGITSESAQGGANGSVIAGIWYFSQPSSCHNSASHCPCVDGVWQGPCFEATSNNVNTIRVRLKTSSTSKLKTLFGKAIGQDSAQFNSTATATLTPRRGVVMFDVSRSVVNDSHSSPFSYSVGGNTYNVTDNNYALFADYRLSPAPACTSLGVPTGPTSTYWNSRLYTVDKLEYLYDTAFIPANYSCISVPNTGGLLGPESQTYLVDTVNRAEPLSSILDGMHQTIQEFRQRAVKGDMLGAIAFDDELLPSRATLTEPYTGTGDSYTIGLVTPDSAEANRVFLATDIPAAGTAQADVLTNLQTRMNLKFFMPRYLGDYTNAIGSRVDAATDLTKALRAASDMLQYGHVRASGEVATVDPNFFHANNFILVFTDGITNCYDTTSPTDRCGNTAAKYGSSFASSAAVINSLSGTGIQVHFVLTGKTVRPNSTLRKDGSKCLTQSRAQEVRPIAETYNSGVHDGYWYVDYDQNQVDPSQPVFDLPNNFYNVIDDTGGLWLPLRPPCSTPSGMTAAQCKNGALQTRFDAACAARVGLSWDGSPWPLVYCLDKNTNQGGSMSSCGVGGSDGVTQGSSFYTDSWGRLFCDPYCRTKKEQVTDYIDEIMGQNPFILVD